LEVCQYDMVELKLDWDQWNVQKNEEKHGTSHDFELCSCTEVDKPTATCYNTR